MGISLFDWQIPPADRLENILKEYNFAILGAATGTGKTVISLDLARRMNTNPVVIAPKIVLSSFRKHAEMMGVTLAGLMNPERIIRPSNGLYDIKAHRWTLPEDTQLVLVDEPHLFASGEKSKSGRAIAELKAYPDLKVVAMSATICNAPTQLRHIGFLAGLHGWATSAWTRFLLEHACYKLPGVRAYRFASAGPASARAIKDIAEKLAPIMVRISADETPGFPSSVVAPKLFDLDKESEEEFNRITAEMDAKLKETTHTNPGIALLRSRQRTELLKTPILKYLATETIDQGISPVIFVQFRETLHELHRQLDGLGIKCSIIIGEQASDDRDKQIEDFQEDRTQAMILTAAAGGVSISLHRLKDSPLRNRATFISPGYSASSLVQCLGRCRRAGGKSVIQTIVLCAKTCETRIFDALQRKINNIETVNDFDLGAPAL